VVVGYVRQGADKERRWLGLTLIELMVAMAVVAIATFGLKSTPGFKMDEMFYFREEYLIFGFPFV